jgi:nitrate/nitrite transporter NarK
MGIGKAAVYKHIPEYFPDNVGSVGGPSGCLGPGGFFLPPLFAYSAQWSGFLTSTFFVLFLLTAACAIWMHWTVVHMLHKESPDLSRHLESPRTPPPPADTTPTPIDSPGPAPRGIPAQPQGEKHMSTTTARKGEWLEAWDPENEATWDSKLAWKTLWITTFCLTLAFIAWFLPSAIIPKLASLGYTFTKGQLYWMAAMPGLAAGLLRILWMVMPPILGTRKLVTITTLLLVPSTLGWGVRVMEPTAPYWELMVLAFLAGIGGGAFSA